MWVKLGTEHLNLDQIFRVRFSKSFKHGQDDLAAEVESFVNGELLIVTRYRGREAQALQAALHAAEQEVPVKAGPAEAVSAAPELAAPFATAASSTNTIHDM